jgi:flagellar M-ring protein FliF
VIQTVVIGIVLMLVVILVIRPVVMRALESANERDDIGGDVDVISNFAGNMPSGNTMPSMEPGRVAAASSYGEQNAGSDPDGGYTNLNSPDDKKKVAMIKSFNDIVDKHPEETVSVIKNWLYQE